MHRARNENPELDDIFLRCARRQSSQIDNHVAGHRLPVLFCFREGGRLPLADGARRGGDHEAKASCRFTMSLVS